MQPPQENIQLGRGPEMLRGLAEMPVQRGTELSQHLIDQLIIRWHLGTSDPVPVNDPPVSAGDDPVGG